MAVPSGSLDPRFSIRKGREQELTAIRNEEAMQMRWIDVGIRSPLLERRWVRSHRKFQLVRLVPNLNRLDKRSGRKNAMPLGARPCSNDLGANGICNPGPKYPLRRR